MTTLEYIKELTAGECPDWVCKQIAQEIDERDARLVDLNAQVIATTETLDTSRAAAESYEMRAVAAEQQRDKLLEHRDALLVDLAASLGREDAITKQRDELLAAIEKAEEYLRECANAPILAAGLRAAIAKVKP